MLKGRRVSTCKEDSQKDSCTALPFKVSQSSATGQGQEPAVVDCLPGGPVGLEDSPGTDLMIARKRITSGPKYHLKTALAYQTSKVVGYLSEAQSKPPK